MNYIVIADDITGANDTGVQFAKKGYKTSVLMNEIESYNNDNDIEVLVLDTDSRMLSPEKAYERVYHLVENLNTTRRTEIYKKVDSTLRGNIGREIDAINDFLQPDIVVIAPGYPKNNRTIINGELLVKGEPIHNTSFSEDPTHPITNSFVPNILNETTSNTIGLITITDLEKEEDFILNKVKRLLEENVKYILFDTKEESDLAKIVYTMRRSKLNILWTGSAGLAEHLTEVKCNKKIQVEKEVDMNPALIIVGSVNYRSRIQVNSLLESNQVLGVELNSNLLLSSWSSRLKETNRVKELAKEGIKKGMDVLIYTSIDEESIKSNINVTRKLNMTPQSVGHLISETLSEIVKEVLEKHQINKLFLTGGETAKKICDRLGVNEFRLVGEVEEGVPIGELSFGNLVIHTITKAGGFGSDKVIINALKLLREGKQ